MITSLYWELTCPNSQHRGCVVGRTIKTLSPACAPFSHLFGPTRTSCNLRLTDSSIPCQQWKCLNSVILILLWCDTSWKKRLREEKHLGKYLTSSFRLVSIQSVFAMSPLLSLFCCFWSTWDQHSPKVSVVPQCESKPLVTQNCLSPKPTHPHSSRASKGLTDITLLLFSQLHRRR